MSPENSENQRAKLRRKLRWHRLVTPLSLCVAVGGLCLSGWIAANQRMMVSPPVVQRGYWVAAHEANKEYVQDMSDYVLTMQNTVTPANADSRSKQILKMVHPENYGAMSSKFQAAVSKLKKEGISTVWEPKSVGVAEGSLCAKWTGNLKRWVGDKPLDPQTKIFLVEFDIDLQGTLYVKTADEATPDVLAASHCQ